MSRPKNPAPTYLLHKRSGQARVRIKTGNRYRDIYLGKYGSPESLEKYQRVLAEYFGDGESNQEGSDTALTPLEDGEEWTVAELAVEYDDFARSHYVKNGETTDDRYERPLPRLSLSTAARPRKSSVPRS